MLSFLVLSDGPCHAQSFRPNEDKSQWWARRDALARIITAACYVGSEAPNPVTKDLIVFFHNGQQETTTTSSTTQSEDVHDKDKLRTAVAIFHPTRLCRDIPIPTEQHLLRALRTSFSKVEKNPVKIMDQWCQDERSGMICSTTLWREHTHRGSSKCAEAGESSNTILTQSNVKSLKHLNVLTLGKKELLAHLQSSCPIEFLRKYHLNGSEKVVLKKVNKTELDHAWEAWNQEYDTSCSKKQQQESQNANHFANQDYDDLLQSFLILLTKKKQVESVGSKRKLGNEQSQLTILLLHEDYPCELPIYGMQNDSCDKANGVHHEVLCVLGGVRDSTDQEITALITAAEMLDIKVVGANLGRTAEFTSKIISTMSMYAMSNRMVHAIERLPAISLKSGVILQKLPSLRSNTWDGYNSKSNSAQPIAITHPITNNTFDQDMTVIAKVPLHRDELCTDIQHREKLFPLVQLFVSTMWKSRMASEDAAGEAQGRGVESKLILIFKDDTVVRLERKEVAEKIAEAHMAAPSEYQVLTMLQSMLQTEHNVIKQHDMSRYSSNSILEKVLFSQLPRKLSKDERKAFLDRTLFFLPKNIRTLSNGSIASFDNQRSVSHKIYENECGCSSQSVSSNLTSFKYFVMFDLCDTSPMDRTLNIGKVLCQWRYKDEEVNEKKLSKVQKKIIEMPLVDNQTITASWGVVLLQQWAYHLRLHHL